MRILQLCKKYPFPPKDGESIAITSLAKALAEAGHEVHLLSMNTSRHYYQIPTDHNPLGHYKIAQTVDIDNRIKPFRAFLNLFTSHSYHLERFMHPRYDSKLRQMLHDTDYDMILLETVYLAPYVDTIRKWSKAKVVMRAHNVEHEIWERLIGKAHFFKRQYLSIITPRLRNYEVAALNKYDLLAGITSRDVTTFRSLGMTIPAMTLPVGLDTRNYLADQRSFDQPLSIGFIGSLDWMPNIEGIKWFFEEVWTPLLSVQYPDLELHIAGRNTPAWLQKAANYRVHIHGEVPDAAAFMLQHSVMIVPLLSGGGMRVKILEAMALGRVNLSTSVGMEGISAAHAQELLVADTPQQYVDAIAFCYQNEQQIKEIGLRAQVFCAKHYDNYRLGQALIAEINPTITASNTNLEHKSSSMLG
jgi:polysaccharide biosynthesis protein PslH